MHTNLHELLKSPFQCKSLAELLCHMQQRTAVTYFAQRDEEQAGAEQIAGVLSGNFTYNDETYLLPANFDWTVNPSDDIEWLILLHKFYFAAGLGDEFRKSGDARYLQKWIELTERWIDTVPLDFLPSDVTGRRVQNWIYAHYYFVHGKPAAAIPADFYAKFLVSLHAQVDHLCHNLTPARNHRTIELYAIFMAAVVFPEFAAAAEWLTFACRELEANLQADLRPDGVHCEQSTDYHHLVVKNYLGVKRLALANGITFAPIFDELLQQALDFAMFVHRPDGMIPSLSDGDSRSFLDLLVQGHAIYDNPAWLYVATGGREGTPPAERSRIFPHAGYTILRSGWGDATAAFRDEHYLIFDCGPLGEGNHGHLDLLNVEIAAYGKALIVDPGRYTYHEPQPESEEPNWRVHFRGTAAHNTVQVDGLNQTRYQFHKRKFKVRGPEPIWDLRDYHLHPDYEIVHGYAASAEYDAVHQRIITFVQKRYWIITDILHAPANHHYDLRFHLNDHAYGKSALSRRDGMTLVRSPNLLLAQPADNLTRVYLEDGFVSRTYGVKHEAPVVRYSRRAADTIFQTVLYPYGATPPLLQVQQLPIEATSPYRHNALVAGLCVTITERNHIHEDTFRLHQGGERIGYEFHYSRQSSERLQLAYTTHHEHEIHPGRTLPMPQLAGVISAEHAQGISAGRNMES